MSKLYEQLKADFPPEAYTVDSSRGFNLTSLKAQYLVERLNEVMGIGGWSHTGEYKEISGGVLYFGKLTLFVEDKEASHYSVGYKEYKKNIGDAYKSAKTESLSKAASYFGIGNDMFKGLINPSKGVAPKKEEKAPPIDDTPMPDDLGLYVRKSGKHKGEALENIPKKDLENFCKFVESLIEKGDKIAQTVEKDYEATFKYLSE